MNIEGLDYNTQREQLILPEYGREIQNMVDYAVSLPTKQERQQCAETIIGIMDRLAPSLYTAGEASALAELFPQCDKISIDYAVMEKSEDIHVIASDLGWSDLGTWGSIKEHLPADGQGNAVVGDDIRLFGCKDCIVHAGGAKTVVAQGLEGYIVAESDGNILVCRLSDEQHIREYAQPKA